MRDAWRLAAGTLTALPWPAPRTVDRRVAGRAMLLGPLAVVPLGVLVAAVGLLGRHVSLPPLAVAVLAVAALALGTRCLHWDGLADVADGLTASYDRERSLAVMKTGAVGPAGVVAVVLVALLQVAGLAPLLGSDRGCLVAGLAVCVSRCALVAACARPVPPARPDGLGATFVGSVALPAAVVVWLAGAAALWAALGSWQGAAAAGIALLVVVGVVGRSVVRLGGVTGDVFGASIELALAALVVVLAA